MSLPELLFTYEIVLRDYGAVPVRYPDKAYYGEKESYWILSKDHALWMVLEMQKSLEEVDKDKLNRWLGFVQALLWKMGAYSIDQMRKHIRDLDTNGGCE